MVVPILQRTVHPAGCFLESAPVNSYLNIVLDGRNVLNVAGKGGYRWPGQTNSWLDDKLPLHPAVAKSATVAAVKRIRSRCMRNKFHYRRSPRLDREAIFGRTEDEARITLRLRAIGVKIDLESMRPIE